MSVTESKTIGFVHPGRPDHPTVTTLHPGTTVGEAINLAGLDPEVVIFGPLGGSLANEENLYDLVEDGSQLTVSPKFYAGERGGCVHAAA